MQVILVPLHFLIQIYSIKFISLPLVMKQLYHMKQVVIQQVLLTVHTVKTQYLHKEQMQYYKFLITKLTQVIIYQTNTIQFLQQVVLTKLEDRLSLIAIEKILMVLQLLLIQDSTFGIKLKIFHQEMDLQIIYLLYHLTRL